ncbi:hypothetical protein C8Q72DRAFT_520194 [Fomitopsis betulina]|nr:hypothetical protein C8Q72DRAFT_520194 [Fomitopsis betulina]
MLLFPFPHLLTARAPLRSSVWVSWNGATDVVSWEILTGSQPDVLVPAAHVRKDGFETEVAVPQAQYVRVQAYNAWGVVLGESHVYGANNTVAAVDGQFRKRSEIDGR